MNNFEEFENKEILTEEEESLLEDHLISELICADCPSETREKMQNLLELEETTYNHRAKEKTVKLTKISHFKCNGSVVGNVIARDLAEKLLPKLEENISEDMEEMTLNEVGDIVTNLEKTMNSEKTDIGTKGQIAERLYNIFLKVNEKRKRNK